MSGPMIMQGCDLGRMIFPFQNDFQRNGGSSTNFIEAGCVLLFLAFKVDFEIFLLEKTQKVGVYNKYKIYYS